MVKKQQGKRQGCGWNGKRMLLPVLCAAVLLILTALALRPEPDGGSFPALEVAGFQISREEYQDLLSQADPTKRVLEKTRYCLPYRGKLLEVDLYPFWQDQAVLEVELEHEDDLISIPEELTVLREVTGDMAYKNAVLAKTDKEVPL